MRHTYTKKPNVAEDFGNTLNTWLRIGAGSGIIAILGFLYRGSLQMQAQKLSFDNFQLSVGKDISLLQGTMASLQVTSASQGSSDRVAFLNSFTASLDSIVRSNTEAAKTNNDRLNATSVRLTEIDRSMKDLLDFKTRIEERERIQGNKP